VASAAEAVASGEAGPAPAGNEMRTKEFVSKLDHDRIVQAIRDVEAKTSAEVRVYIQRGKLDGDALAAAQARFQKLGMDQTQERNAVLVFVAPRAHKFAVVGDKAIHERCGEQLWQSVVDRMRAHFQEERFGEALVEAIEEVGKALAAHFPKRSTEANELPDDLVEG
jgi:uncharacterized membrane protein